MGDSSESPVFSQRPCGQRTVRNANFLSQQRRAPRPTSPVVWLGWSR